MTARSCAPPDSSLPAVPGSAAGPEPLPQAPEGGTRGGDEITPEELAAHEAETAEIYAEEAAEQQELRDAEYEAEAEFDREEALAKHLAQWQRFRGDLGTDLLAVDTTQPIRWVPGADQVLKRGVRAMFFASRGAGKSLAMLHLAVDVCMAGGRVVVVDVENDEDEVAERLQMIVESRGEAARMAVDEMFCYLSDFSFSALRESEEALEAWASTVRVSDLLILDSIARMLAQCDYEENSNTDFTKWMSEFVDPIAKVAKTSVLLLDNAGHKGKQARGASAKADLVEVAFKVTGGGGVGPEKHGRLKLTRERSRSGREAELVTIESGAGDYGPLEPKEGNAATLSAVEMEQRRAEMAGFFRDAHGYCNMVAVKARFPNIGETTLRQDIQQLVSDGIVECWIEGQAPKPGRGAWWHVRTPTPVHLKVHTVSESPKQMPGTPTLTGFAE